MQPDSITFAHLSDPHLSSLVGVRVRDLMNKRILGYLSWRHRRRREHRSEVLDALQRDLSVTRPDHVVVTGDLTHVGLPHEFREARQWLETLGRPEFVTVVPGNHDAYVHMPWDRTFSQWASYMHGDEDWRHGLVDDEDSTFPSVRVRGPVAFVGLSTARPSAPFFAVGRLGARQIERLESILNRAREQNLFRVVLVHHPPMPSAEKWRKRLTDGDALCAILERAGAELILHGHTHRSVRMELETVAGSVPIVGVPSASALGHKPGRTARYHLCRVQRLGDGRWDLGISAREYSPEDDAFSEPLAELPTTAV